MVYGYILGIDSFALGLIRAEALIRDGRIEEFICERYNSYQSELGQRIRNGETTLAELAERAAELKAPSDPGSGRQEYLESILNQVIFS